jgi:hypothetical protein
MHKHKSFSFQKGYGCCAAGWFVCACVGPMMDAHGCWCCTCLMNPQAGNHSLSLSNKFDLFYGLEATWKSLWWSHSLRAIGPKSMPLLDSQLAPKQESERTREEAQLLSDVGNCFRIFRNFPNYVRGESNFVLHKRWSPITPSNLPICMAIVHLSKRMVGKQREFWPGAAAEKLKGDFNSLYVIWCNSCAGVIFTSLVYK